jgi:hypothetical protein
VSEPTEGTDHSEAKALLKQKMLELILANRESVVAVDVDTLEMLEDMKAAISEVIEGFPGDVSVIPEEDLAAVIEEYISAAAQEAVG